MEIKKNALPRLINYTLINIDQQTQTMDVSVSATQNIM